MGLRQLVSCALHHGTERAHGHRGKRVIVVPGEHVVISGGNVQVDGVT